MVPCRTLPEGFPIGDKLWDFWRDESAATAVEYAIVAAGIGGTVALTIYSLGDLVQREYYARILEAVQSAKAPTP